METGHYIFGEFVVDAAAFELQRNGERVHLERIPMELLLLLVSRQGDLVSREEIIEKLWGNQIFIDTNTAINVAVRKVRHALDDNFESPHYILTVPAKGYRFIAPISVEPARHPEGDPDALASNPAQPHVATEVDEQLGSGRSRQRWWIWAAAAIILAAATVAVLRMKRHTPTAKPMFVVLPFQNLTGDPNQEYIADGMTEEMITQIGGLDPEHIGVIARTSSMQFKATHKSTAEIARELGVGYLLEGSVRRAGDHMRVTAQLIQASDQTHLWAADYDSDLSDLLRIESDIAIAVAGQVQQRLDATSRARFARPVAPEAQTAYFRGLADWNLRTSSSIADAISEFQRAIAADPNYALPYAALARCYVIGPVYGVGNPVETMPLAREFATRALKLDPDLAEAHSVLAMVAAHYDYDWPTAEREFFAALRLNPSDPYAHFFYSNSFLSPHGRHNEAISEMQKTIALDPLSPPFQAFLIRTYIWARRYDDARSQFEKVIEVAPNMPLLHERAAHLFGYTGNLQEAIEEDARARLLSGQQAEQVIAEKDLQMAALRQGGAQGYWRAQLRLSREMFQPPEAYAKPFGLAVIYARLGLKDLALSSLERAFDSRDVQLTEINVEPAFDGLHDDPRFRLLLRRLALP